MALTFNPFTGNFDYTGESTVYDTEANILASTENAGILAVASDTNINGHHHVFVSLGAGAWMKMPFPAIPISGSPDMGIDNENNLLGYGREYITNKSLNNVTIGGKSMTTNGGFWLDQTVSPSVLYIYADDAVQTILKDFSTALGYLVHYPFETDEAVKVWSGMSVEVGLNGRPSINEYDVDMGPYPAPRIINGGTY